MNAVEKAVRYFLENTGLRKCPTRDRLVQSIRNHSRPMTLAKRLVAQNPKPLRLVDWDRLCSDLNKLQARKGLPDPVFDGMILKARAAVYNGTWTVEQHNKLMKILKDSWSPWSKEDIAIQKAQARMKKYAI